MGTCDFCKAESEEQLKSCVCKKASYCSKECQAKDWKSHKPSCPPFIIRESPGKGRGLFATRNIKEGQLILEEYPLLTISDGKSLHEFTAIYYPNIEEDTKAKILKLHDPAENLKNLDNDIVEKLASKTDESSKIYRIFIGNSFPICGEEWYDTTEFGLYNNISLINHACVPNATKSWVMGDFKRQQVKAMKTIEKDEEILVNYQCGSEVDFGSREFRMQELLGLNGILCSCSECSLEGEALVNNDLMRAELREKAAEITQLLRLYPLPRRDVKKAMKLSQQHTKLLQKLGLRAAFVPAMIGFYCAAIMARRMDISILENDPEVFKQEALKYAKMFGDRYIHYYNKNINNF